MAEQKTAKVIIKKKKFHSVEIPLVNTKIELIGETVGDLKDKTINLDLTLKIWGREIILNILYVICIYYIVCMYII